MDEKYNEDSIRGLSIRHHIQMRPKLYFQNCFDENSLDALPFEVLCHALDEYFDEKCNKIQMEIFSDYFVVTYNAGMSLELSKENITKAEIIMTQIGACKNEKKHLEVGDEFCRVGMAVINYASEKCELTTASKGKKGVFVFKNGELVFKESSDCNKIDDSTTILIKPNRNLFENLRFTSRGIRKKTEQLNVKLVNLEIEVIDSVE